MPLYIYKDFINTILASLRNLPHGPIKFSLNLNYLYSLKSPENKKIQETIPLRQTTLLLHIYKTIPLKKISCLEYRIFLKIIKKW
jgi:hypothetical protein